MEEVPVAKPEGGRRGKMSPWIKHVLSFKKPGMSLGDAMKAAKPSWKSSSKTRKGKGKMMGGTAAGFTGGPYTGSDLADGMSRFPALPDATYHNPGSELLRGGRRRRGGTKKMTKRGGVLVGMAPPMGGRRRKHTRGRRHRGGNAGAYGTDPREVYGAASSDAHRAATAAATARNQAGGLVE